MQLHLSRDPRLAAPGGAVQPLAPLDAALLAWLAIEGPTPRARLAQLLWPDKDGEAARNSLRQRLFQLHKRTGRELVAGSATLALAEGVAHDLEEADTLLGEAAGEDLAAGEFAQWLALQRARRQARVRTALVELADMAEAARDWDDALAHARELLALDPLSEDAHRRVIRLHYLAGDRAAALLAFDRCEQVLKHEIGARPSAETLALLKTLERSGPAVPAATPIALQVPAAVLRPPRLVGRERELAALDEAWRAGQVAAVIGEAGMGKTRLLDEFIGLRRGLVRAAGRPGDAGVPLSTLARLLRAVVEQGHAEALAMLAPATRSEIARVLPEFDGAGLRAAGEGQRLVLLRAVRALLGAFAQVSTAVLDDLHFADAASLDMLGHLIDAEAPAGTAAPLRWILALRPSEAGSPARALQEQLVEQARLVPVAVAPLGEAALADLVDSLGLPGIAGSALAPGLLQRTGGNPLFVLETLKQAWIENTLADLADARRLPRPLSVGRLIERRLAQLSPAALAVARVAAIAGVDFGIALAEQVLQAPAMALADAVGELEAAQVLRGDAFAHDLVADAVHGSVPATVAVHTHAQVAAWLEQHGGEPARIARHWIDARQEPRALPWLAQAADAARRGLRHRECVAFLEAKSAIEWASGQAAAAFSSLYDAAELSVSMEGQRVEGLALCERLDRLAATPEQTLLAWLLRAGLLTFVGDSAGAIEVAQRALALAEASGQTRLAMHCHRVLSDAHTVGSRFGDAVRHGLACIDWIDAHDDDSGRSTAHGALALSLDNVGRGAEALPHHELSLSLAARAGDLQQASVASCNLARSRIFMGHLAAADDALAHGARLLASYEGSGSHLPQLRVLRAWTLCSLGRFGEGLVSAESALQLAQQAHPGHTVLAWIRLASCWWQLGQWGRVKQALDAVPASARQNLAVRVGHARVSWAYLHATGADAAAAQAQRQVLQDVLDGIGDGERPDLRLPLALELAEAEGSQRALDRIEAVRLEAERIGHGNVVLGARLRAADVACGIDPARARREALAALALRAEGVLTTALLPAALWLHTSRALASAGDRAHATELAEEGAAWLKTHAAEHVPEAFRDSFLHRNPVNRELLALAMRLRAAPAAPRD